MWFRRCRLRNALSRSLFSRTPPAVARQVGRDLEQVASGLAFIHFGGFGGQESAVGLLPQVLRQIAFSAGADQISQERPRSPLVERAENSLVHPESTLHVALANFFGWRECDLQVHGTRLRLVRHC